ncbi:hydrolase 76 protein [Blyttiomyces sp. JEL0837]|nr:hydrolase 76 protein [Blyttiomyces sp. JEL0837]
MNLLHRINNNDYNNMYLSLPLLALLACLSHKVHAGMTLNVNDPAAVGKALVSSMKWLTYYYYPSNYGDGAWNQTVVQWHESGEYNDAFLEYHKLTGDTTYDSFAVGNMFLSSFGPTGDFLDGANQPIQNTLYGKWNDDIAWWALAATTGAEIWGKTSYIQPPTTISDTHGAQWFTIADLTLNEMLNQWDPICGGGIYWSRNRLATNPQQRTYKSTIANAQLIELAGRLLVLSGNGTYKDLADRTYAWLKSSTIIDVDYTVADGINALDAGCSAKDIDRSLFSYQPGVLLSGLSSLYKATGDQTYLTEATNLYNAAIKTFVNPSTNVLHDPTCEQNPGYCKDPTGFLWAMYKGLANFYLTTTDSTIKSTISMVLGNTVSSMVGTLPCEQGPWNCVRTFMDGTKHPYTYENGTNPRDQFEVVMALTALAKVNGLSVDQGAIQTGVVAGGAGTGGNGAVATGGAGSAGSGGSAGGSTKSAGSGLGLKGVWVGGVVVGLVSVLVVFGM